MSFSEYLAILISWSYPTGADRPAIKTMNIWYSSFGLVSEWVRTILVGVTSLGVTLFVSVHLSGLFCLAWLVLFYLFWFLLVNGHVWSDLYCLNGLVSTGMPSLLYMGRSGLMYLSLFFLASTYLIILTRSERHCMTWLDLALCILTDLVQSSLSSQL